MVIFVGRGWVRRGSNVLGTLDRYMIRFCGQGNNLLIVCIGISPATASNTILEKSVESTDNARDVRVGPFYSTRFFKLHLKTEIGVSRLGEGLEEYREEPIVVLGVLISTLSDNLFPQSQHLLGQFLSATRLKVHYLQALLLILYVYNQMGFHHTDCELEKPKLVKNTPTCHFVSVKEGILLC